MFPEVIFLGLDLYYWMIIVGILAAMIFFRLFYKKVGISDRVFNFALIVAIPGIVLGYLSAVLFQSWFSYLQTGKFVWGVGATFYGGLIGAVVFYLAIYFGVGHFLFRDRSHVAQFNLVLFLAVPCIVLAHAFGRLGCLFAGCCYGSVTESAIGINMWVNGQWQRRVPVQLFESLFLFLLFAVLLFLAVKKKCEYTASIYLIVYGIWRFFIEFARDDDRGSSGIEFLSPSQLTAILLVAMGIAFIFIYRYVLKKLFVRAGANEEI